MRVLSDATVQLAGRCNVGHKNANRLKADGSACTLVAGTQDACCDRGFESHRGHVCCVCYVCQVKVSATS
jgi:hypothetical protein